MEQQEKQDSYSIGTNAKGGVLKIYFDIRNLEETQEAIDNFFKVKEYLLQKYGVVLT